MCNTIGLENAIKIIDLVIFIQRGSNNPRTCLPKHFPKLRYNGTCTRSASGRFHLKVFIRNIAPYSGTLPIKLGVLSWGCYLQNFQLSQFPSFLTVTTFHLPPLMLFVCYMLNKLLFLYFFISHSDANFSCVLL